MFFSLFAGLFEEWSDHPKKCLSPHVLSGVINLPNSWGDQTMQMHGDFEGFPLFCIVWVGVI